MFENYMVGDLRNCMNYIDLMSKHGCSKMPPLIVTCAITGGLHGKEVNPALPESIEEQVEAAYEAYNAGASMVHVHVRQSDNPMLMTNNWKDFAECNARIREKCPSLIINNTCLGGRRILVDENIITEPMTVSINARPEVASLDTSNFAEDYRVKARKPPLFGRDDDGILPFYYILTNKDAEFVTSLMNENNIKPEFECFDIADIKYVKRLIDLEMVQEPAWISIVIGGSGTFPSPELLIAATHSLPDKSLLNVVGLGASQFPMLAMAIILGHHVRVGLEDNIYYAPGELAKSNAQLVERVIRLAREIGRPIASPDEAREMMGLGSPRRYDMPK